MTVIEFIGRPTTIYQTTDNDCSGINEMTSNDWSRIDRTSSIHRSRINGRTRNNRTNVNRTSNYNRNRFILKSSSSQSTRINGPRCLSSFFMGLFIPMPVYIEKGTAVFVGCLGTYTVPKSLKVRNSWPEIHRNKYLGLSKNYDLWLILMQYLESNLREVVCFKLSTENVRSRSPLGGWTPGWWANDPLWNGEAN